MICKSCGEDKLPERFPLEEGLDKREQTCKGCRRLINRILRLQELLKEEKEKGKQLKSLWIECIEACEVNNGRRLRIIIDKVKKIIGGFYSRKVANH